MCIDMLNQGGIFKILCLYGKKIRVLVMYVCDDFIYVQMHKTGCTHITSIFSELFGGNQINGDINFGKHNSLTPEQVKSRKYIVSSIRNPWDWYLSLWTYGVQGKGKLMLRLTKRHILRSLQFNEIYGGLFSELRKKTHIWKKLYCTDEDIISFRQWIKRIHDPIYSRDLGEGYAETLVKNWCGFMTYRYLYLNCGRQDLLKSKIRSYELLKDFEKENCYINFFLRQENLEEDVYDFSRKIKNLNIADKKVIFNKCKTNQSKRSFLISEYYDRETIDLVSCRDRLLIEKFNYCPPKI